MLQLVVTIIIYLILVIPVGRYLYHIAAEKSPRKSTLSGTRSSTGWMVPSIAWAGSTPAKG